MAGRRSISEQVSDEPVEALTRRPSREKRTRRWEKSHPRVSYRGVPPELQAELKQVATALSVPVGQVARAFLEFGLAAYKCGDLVLEPEPVVGEARGARAESDGL